MEVIRTGDTVRVVNSKLVKRVGYPLTWKDLMDEVENDPRVRQAYNLLTDQPELPGEFLSLKGPPAMPRYFLQACAKLEVLNRGFGGNERSIHYYPTWEDSGDDVLRSTGVYHAPDYTGRQLRVTKKRLAKTGTRFAPSGGVSYGYDGPEDWYEPGGLENEKTHVLLTLEGGYEIERINVELVKRG